MTNTAEIKYETANLQETWSLAKKLLDEIGDNNIILLEGDLGAGKTAFAQGLLSALSAEGPFTSPTFVVMKDYKLDEKFGFKRAFHFDCYRISADDLTEFSWEEISENKKNLVIIEWPRRIRQALPKKFIHVNIETISENKRKISIKNN